MSKDQWLAEEVEAFSNNLEEYIAAFYNDPTWKALRNRITRLVVSKTRSRRISVLDLGSGPMPSLPGLYEFASRYVCVEPSKQFADHLHKYYPNVTVIQESIEALVQHEKESFDVVLCFGVLHHIYSPMKVVESISGWVDNGGVFVTDDPSDYWNDKMGSPNERGFTRQELLSMVKPYFNDVQIYSHHFPGLRRSIYRFLSALKLWPLVRSQKLGRLVIELEFALDKLGVSGTNFLVIATDADLGVSSVQSTTGDFFMSLKWNIVRFFDRPGCRLILGKLATQIARRKLGTDVEIFYNELWVHRLGLHYYPDGPKLSDIRFREDRANNYINTTKDYWFYYFHPEKGDVVIDVGAGHGEDTLAFSQAVEERGKVIAVEAHPLSFKFLECFCRLNRLTNTIPLHTSVMDKSGTVSMIEVEENWQANFVDFNGQSGSIEVSAATLDEISETLAVKEVAFLKMNIEGAERYALLGMKQLIHRTQSICVACHDFLADNGLGEHFRTRAFVEQFLIEHGFKVFSRPNDSRNYIRDIIYGHR